MFGFDKCSLAYCHVRSLDAPVSRRQLFPTFAGAMSAIAAVITLGTSEVAYAQTKMDKKTAKYQDNPNNGQICSECRFFQPPKSCQVVDGDISPNGWCSLFAKKT